MMNAMVNRKSENRPEVRAVQEPARIRNHDLLRATTDPVPVSLETAVPVRPPFLCHHLS